MLDRRLSFSVSLRFLSAILAALAIFGLATGLLLWKHHNALKVQKAEYRRRLRFLERGNKAIEATSGILDAYPNGDAAFGLSRQHALAEAAAFRTLATTGLESELASSNEAVIVLYSDCRGRLGACTSELDQAQFNYTKIADELSREADKYDPRTPKQKAEDDPLSDDPPTPAKP